MIPYSVSFKALLENDGCCLMLKRSDNCTNNPGRWDLPGGKPEKGEPLEEALRREIREETGMEIELTGLAGAVQSESPGFHVVNVIMTGRAAGGSITLSHEHQDSGWFSADQIKDMDLLEHLKQVALEYFKKNELCVPSAVDH